MVSVALASYNGAKFIEVQIKSILSQLGPGDELVISDDGSLDGTLDIIRSFSDNRIKIFINAKKGILSNFENALRHVSGEYIFLADQDDIWLPNKVQIMRSALESADLVVSDAFVAHSECDLAEKSYHEQNGSKFGVFGVFLKNPFLGCCMAFRRTVLVKVLPFPIDIPMHDIWIGSVAKFYFKTTILKEKLIYYRRHGGNASAATETSPFSVFEKLSFRVVIVKNLIKILFK
jgi:glycosyltransferase involved in cell wall biosynthesis